MKKLLYIALANIDDTSDGVSKKIISQCEAFKRNNLEVFLVSYGIEGCYIFTNGTKQLLCKYSKTVHRRNLLFKQIKQYIKTHNFDICYIRYPYCDLNFITMLEQISKNNIKIVIEIATYPLIYPKFKDIKKWVIGIQDKIFNKFLKKYVSQILTIGNKVEKVFGIDTVNISNGADISQYPLKNNLNIKDEINLITVSYMYNTHGYDRLIKGLGNFYQSKLNLEIKIKLHMVGEGPELNLLKELTNKYGIEDKIIFYGVLNGKELNDLYDICDIGIGPLGVFRNGIFAASPLKTREYFARGIPFICAYDEIGLEPNYPNVFKINADESDVNINEIVKFSKRIKNESKQISSEMRNYATKNYDWKEILKFIK